MTESTARAERFDLQTSTSPFYTWEVPQKPISVRIPYGLMDRLEKEAVDNFRSLSSRGSEIGGLLLGSVSPGNPMVVSLTDFELISCDYSKGPLYRLSDADIARFERAVQQRLGVGQGIAGFFRSQTRKGMALDADDISFFEQKFRDPHHLILLVRPYATKASTAGIFIREGGKINGDSSLLEFPFRSSELGPAKTADPVESAPKAAAPAAPPAPPKPAARAQIVPIASRRETLSPEPVATPEPPVVPAAPVAPPPAPTKSSVSVAPPKPAAPTTTSKNVAPPSPAKTQAVPAAAPPVPEDKSRSDKGKASEKPGAKSEKAAPPAPAPAKPAEKAVVAEKPAVAEKAAPAPAAKTAVVKEPVPEVEEAPKSNKLVKLLLAAAACLALIVVLFFYPGIMRTGSKAPTTTAVDTSPLQLRVERTAGELLLTWNRDSDAIRGATKAVLQINDGDQHENVEMDLAQLRNGSIVYSPSGADISFKMEVTGKNDQKVASESVRVLRTRPSPMQDQAQPNAPGNSQTAAKPGTNAVTPPVPNVANGKPGTPDATTTPAPEEPKPAAQPAAPVKPFSTASLGQRLRPTTTSDLPDAPTLAGAGQVPAAIPGMNLGGGVSAPAAPQAPAPPRPAAPSAPAGPTTTTQTTPQPVQPAAANSKSGGQIQQATLIYKKDPEYPKIAKQTGAKGQVKLVATIGKDGKVKAVRVLSGHPMLQNAASDAVKQWIYKPTLLNGAPVETETEIVVNFLGDR